MTKTHSINGLSDLSGLDRRTIKKFLLAKFPGHTSEDWTLREFTQGLIEFYKPKATEAEERKRRTTLQADLLEIEKRRLTQELIETELIGDFMADFIITTRTGFMNMPMNIARDLEGKTWIKIYEILDKETRAVLEHLSGMTIEEFCKTALGKYTNKGKNNEDDDTEN